MSSTKIGSPEYMAADRHQQLLNVTLVFAVLEILCISLYFISKFKSKQRFGLDTYLMIPAFIACFSHPLICFYGDKHAHTGKHVITATIQELNVWMKLEATTVFVYPPSVALPKLSILCLYLRIFTERRYRYAVYAIASILVLNWLSAWILFFCACRPLKYMWDKAVPGGHCIDNMKVFVWYSLPNIVTDVAMLVLPLPVLWKLHVSAHQKIGLTITFLTFSIGMIIAIVRFTIVIHMNIYLDPTWFVIDIQKWTVGEPGAYLIAACLPSFRPLFGPLFNRIDFGSIGQILRYGSKATSGAGAVENNSPYRISSGVESSNLRRGFDRLDTPSSSDKKKFPTRNIEEINDESDLEHGSHSQSFPQSGDPFYGNHALPSLPIVARSACAQCGKQFCLDTGHDVIGFAR